MSSHSTEVLLKLNQLLELHKLYFDGMADSFVLVGIQHRGIMLLLDSVEQRLIKFEQRLDNVVRRLEHPQQESRGVGTQVPSGTGPGSVPASSRHCSPFGGGVQGVHIVIGEASPGGTGVVPGSPPGDVSRPFTEWFLMLISLSGKLRSSRCSPRTSASPKGRPYASRGASSS